jgi:hypothetical protein
MAWIFKKKSQVLYFMTYVCRENEVKKENKNKIEMFSF